MLGSICVTLDTMVNVIAVFAVVRWLKSAVDHTARARQLTTASGVTLLGLGACLALARREA
jgi:threonine/homoserine/homoserine lactone efflux protein